MKIFGQPKSYSDMLERIFYFTLGIGFCCVFWLSTSSPSVKDILDSISMETDIGIIKGVKALYVIIPLLVAIISRIIRLHDKISDLFLIRQNFDTKYILIPMARQVGSTASSFVIKKNRVNMMYKVFYQYAGFKDPVIDAQLTRSALDNWGWYWVTLEAACLFLITMVIFLIIDKITQFFVSFVIGLFLIAFSFYQYKVCIGSATAELNAILYDDNRKKAIFDSFSILENESKVK
jgi:hypothetical protein